MAALRTTSFSSTLFFFPSVFLSSRLSFSRHFSFLSRSSYSVRLSKRKLSVKWFLGSGSFSKFMEALELKSNLKHCRQHMTSDTHLSSRYQTGWVRLPLRRRGSHWRCSGCPVEASPGRFWWCSLTLAPAKTHMVNSYRTALYQEAYFPPAPRALTFDLQQVKRQTFPLRTSTVSHKLYISLLHSYWNYCWTAMKFWRLKRIFWCWSLKKSLWQY